MTTTAVMFVFGFFLGVLVPLIVGDIVKYLRKK